MNIARVQFAKNFILQGQNNNQNSYKTGFRSKSLEADCFVRQSSKTNEVSFTAQEMTLSKRFEEDFPKTFFRKLANEHLPCAYTGIEMIPYSAIESLKEKQVLQKKGPIAIKYLKSYRNSMLPIEREIFTYLETESKKHPNLKLQELLRLRFDAAEKSLINQQGQILDKMNFISRELPREDYLKTRKLINEQFDKMFDPEPVPEDRFRRQEFILQLKNLKLKDTETKKKLITMAEQLPKSSDSVNAFVIKYSLPTKIKYEDGKLVTYPRDSEELGLRLLSPSVATDEHVYPQELYKLEEQDHHKKERLVPHHTPNYRVTVLTTKFINNMKGNAQIDDFYKSSGLNINKNAQNHINRLIEVEKIWLKKGEIEDAMRLNMYIHVLKREFEARSELITIDTRELDKIEKTVTKAYAQHHIESGKKKKVNTKPAKRKRRPNSADNTHKEVYTNPNGTVMENRKIQKHVSRFSK